MYMSAVSRLVLLTTMVASACAQVDPTGTDMPDAALYYAMASAPAGPGWQAEARAQVAANVQSPLVAARIFAALGVAQYAAITDVAGAKGIGNGGRSLHEAERGAIAGASARVLSFFYPAGTAAFEERVQNEASAGPGNVHPAFTRGLAVGRAAGDWMVARIQSDGFTTPWAGTIPTGPGIFVPNGPPAGPGFGAVTPYFLTAGNQFRPDGNGLQRRSYLVRYPGRKIAQRGEPIGVLQLVAALDHLTLESFDIILFVISPSGNLGGKALRRVLMSAPTVPLIVLALAALLLLPALAELTATHFSPGVGLKTAAIISFFVTVLLMIVFALVSGDGLLGEVQFILVGFLLFFLIFWLMVAWIF